MGFVWICHHLDDGIQSLIIHMKLPLVNPSKTSSDLGSQQMPGWRTSLAWWWPTPKFFSLMWFVCCVISGVSWVGTCRWDGRLGSGGEIRVPIPGSRGNQVRLWGWVEFEETTGKRGHMWTSGCHLFVRMNCLKYIYLCSYRYVNSWDFLQNHIPQNRFERWVSIWFCGPICFCKVFFPEAKPKKQPVPTRGRRNRNICACRMMFWCIWPMCLRAFLVRNLGFWGFRGLCENGVRQINHESYLWLLPVFLTLCRFEDFNGQFPHSFIEGVLQDGGPSCSRHHVTIL